MENYTIHRLEKENFNLLIPLMQDCFGMDVDISYFKWKYIDNPDGFVRGYYAKSTTHEIAAYYGVIPQKIMYFGEEKLIFQSCDTMTHSMHRRKGLFQLLAKHCYAELERESKLFIIGFGGSESTPGFIKFGWKHLFDCKNYFYPSIFASLTLKNKFNKIETLKKDNLNEINHLLRNKELNKIFTNQDIAKYSWKLNNPHHSYNIKIFKKNDDKISSFIIYFIDKNKIQLIDYYFDNNSEGKKLVKHVILDENKKQKVIGIIAFCQENGPWCMALKRLGFISNPFSKGALSHKTPFITFTNKEDLKLIDNSMNWNITPFDHDSL